MLQQAIVTIVDFCTRYAAQIIGIAALLGLAAAVYAAGHFAIDADVNKLISKDLPWRQREVAFEKSFPPKEETILAVIDAPTSELATHATAALIQKLSDQKDHFHSILEAGGGPFFQKNGLLFLPTPEVVALTKKLGEAKPLIQTLAQDSNLRGLTTALNYGLIGARMNQFTLDNLSGTLNMVSDTLDEAIAGRPASFSWRAMLNGRPPTPDERRRFVEIRPVLDYAALMPGKVATDAIRQAAADLDIGARYGARLRLTGPVAIADEEYATLEEGAFTNTTVTIVVVLTILWLALRSFGIILAVAISLVVGLSITAAIGLLGLLPQLIARGDETGRAALVNTTLLFRVGVIAVVTLIIWLPRHLLAAAALGQGVLPYLDQVPAMILVASLDQLLFGMLQGFQAYRSLAIAQILRSVLRLGLTAMLLGPLALGVTGLAALRITTTDQNDRTVLDFWRCAMLPMRNPGADTGHHADLAAIGAPPPRALAKQDKSGFTP